MKKSRATVVHLTEGFSWAGIENHLFHLLPSLSFYSDFNIVFGAFHKGQITNRLREKKLETYTLNRRSTLDLSVFVRLVRQLKRRNADILHMHGYLSVIYGIPTALLARVPIKVVTLHADPLPLGRGIAQIKLRIFLYIAFLLIKWTNTQLIAVSEDIARSHKKVCKLKAENIRVIRNGISIEEIHSQVSPQVTSEKDIAKPVVGIVGRIDKNKGHIYFIKAAEQLVSMGIDAKFWVIGAGPLEESLKEYCAKSNMEAHIEFFGFREDIQRYLAQLDVIVIPSLHEGIPYTMLEAMSLGIPVVASAVGGIPEVIEDSVNGFLIPIKRPDEIVSRVRSILQDPQLGERISTAALRTVSERFSSTIMAEATKHAYYDYLDANVRSERGGSA